MTICKHYNGIHRISLLTIPTAIVTIKDTHIFGIVNSILKAHGVGVPGMNSDNRAWEGVEIFVPSTSKAVAHGGYRLNASGDGLYHIAMHTVI